MGKLKRVFILGAGFSKPARMPVVNQLLPLLVEKLPLDEMREWLDGLCHRMAWFSGSDQETNLLPLNIEQVFHYAYFDIEVFRLRQHLAPVGRLDGPGTPWNHAESIEYWLSYLEDTLRDVISEREDNCDLAPITRWADAVTEHDSVLTFNYDTLAERGLTGSGKAWNHGMECEGDNGIPVYKLHGSIDWIVAHRAEKNFGKLELLFDKPNANRADGDTGHVEDDYRLWRCQTREQRRNWIKGRDFQIVHKDATPKTVGIAGLGAYKELHQVPGLGPVWARGMRALYLADHAVVVGFAMSDFDAMAQMQFAEVAQARQRDGRPITVYVVDPHIDKAGEDRFRRVFRPVEFSSKKHEEFDWSSLSGVQPSPRGPGR